MLHNNTAVPLCTHCPRATGMPSTGILHPVSNPLERTVGPRFSLATSLHFGILPVIRYFRAGLPPKSCFTFVWNFGQNYIMAFKMAQISHVTGYFSTPNYCVLPLLKWRQKQKLHNHFTSLQLFKGRKNVH